MASKKKAPGISFQGNVPEDPKLMALFIQSGSYRHVQSGWKGSDEKGSIKERRSYIVEPDTAKELITFATEKLYGRKVRKQGVQRPKMRARSMDYARELDVKIHYSIRGLAWPLCGPFKPVPLMTSNKKRVTCGACLKKLK